MLTQILEHKGKIITIALVIIAIYYFYQKNYGEK